ncbi:hypothetical protein, partial [Nocardia alni]|uniref:hypothetical protein n=1 Tax=Nocardia alni TaxID=2815723 RepID=UPI001C232031
VTPTAVAPLDPGTLDTNTLDPAESSTTPVINTKDPEQPTPIAPQLSAESPSDTEELSENTPSPDLPFDILPLGSPKLEHAPPPAEPTTSADHGEATEHTDTPLAELLSPEYFDQPDTDGRFLPHETQPTEPSTSLHPQSEPVSPHDDETVYSPQTPSPTGTARFAPLDDGRSDYSESVYSTDDQVPPRTIEAQATEDASGADIQPSTPPTQPRSPSTPETDTQNRPFGPNASVAELRRNDNDASLRTEEDRESVHTTERPIAAVLEQPARQPLSPRSGNILTESPQQPTRHVRWVADLPSRSDARKRPSPLVARAEQPTDPRLHD